MSSKVKFYKENWKAIYNLLYVYFIQILIMLCTIYEIQPVESSVAFIWPKVKGLKVI